MIDLLSLHKQFILTHLREGDAAADFTMGNGYDTLFLSETVGPSGRVYAFDIQQQALDSTEARLRNAGAPENWTLIRASHHLAAGYIDRKIRAGMFNLGWLPGGDKSITTLRETTLPAVKGAIGLLDRDSCLTVAVYPGHAEGDAEGKLLEEYFSCLSRHSICVTKVCIVNSPSSPYFFLIETK